MGLRRTIRRIRNRYHLLDEKNSRYYALHQILNVKDVPSECTLVRIGGGSDGGYVMAEPYSSTKIAYSFGIGDNVTWDRVMADAGYEVYQYDHTIDQLPEENPHFHWKKLGVSGNEGGQDMKPLTELIRENGHEKETGMLLKMDIEGWEYPVFADIDDAVLNQFDQMVFELHDLLDYPENPVMNRALERLSRTHQIVHVHANNAGAHDVYGNLVTPTLLEVTMLNKAKYHFEPCKTMFPTSLDAVNIEGRAEIPLGRWNVD